jgi:UDP-3-O-[3-hydroxymyristoyl] glucosamine N-acyltransferase
MALVLHQILMERTLKIPQIGNVIIEDNVDIGSVRRLIEQQWFYNYQKRVKLDNQIQIAHNVEIEITQLLQLKLSCTNKIGKNGLICGASWNLHLTIGNNVRIQAQSGVGRNIKDNEIVQEPHLDTMILANHTFILRICLKLLQK